VRGGIRRGRRGGPGLPRREKGKLAGSDLRDMGQKLGCQGKRVPV